MISNLTIDADRAQGRALFRIKHWEVALIVSEELKANFERIPNLGIVFQPVCWLHFLRSSLHSGQKKGDAAQIQSL
jgi:hypothetical protein